MTYRDYRKEKVLRYLDSLKYGWRKFPPSLQVGLTDRCFNKCVMCGHWKREVKSEIDVDKLIMFLRFAKMRGLETVCYSGGDPFKYPAEKLSKLIDFHIDTGIAYGFITAGYIPVSYDVDLASADFVRVSLDSVDEHVYAKSRGGVKFRHVIESVDNMLFNGVKVGLGITLHKLNYNNVSDVFDYAVKRQIGEVRVWPCREVPKIGLDTIDALKLGKILYKYADIFDLVDVSNNLRETADNLVINSETLGLEFTRCYACFYQLFVHPNCDVYPCCITAGDTQDASHCAPLFNFSNIDENDQVKWKFDGYWDDARRWNKNILGKHLPPICSRNCIPRLSTINHFAELEINKSLFL